MVGTKDQDVDIKYKVKVVGTEGQGVAIMYKVRKWWAQKIRV